MNTIIKDLQKIPFSGSEIVEALDGAVKIVKYPSIHQYQSIDELLRPYGRVVILYETEERYGHWCCLFLKNDVLEFFDPYGYKIDEQLKFIDESYKKTSNQNYPFLARLMFNSPYRLAYNDVQLQSEKKDVSSCGRHVTMRLIMSDVPIKLYQDIMKSKGSSTPDERVTELTAFI